MIPDDHFLRALDDLRRLVSLPSVSARGDNLVECAQAVRDLLDEAGFRTEICRGGIGPYRRRRDRRRAADRHDLQSLRRPAGGSRRALAEPALRAHRAGWTMVRTRCRRRQGRVRQPPCRLALVPGAASRRLAVQADLAGGRRGGDRQSVVGRVPEATLSGREGRCLLVGIWRDQFERASHHPLRIQGRDGRRAALPDREGRSAFEPRRRLRQSPLASRRRDRIVARQVRARPDRRLLRCRPGAGARRKAISRPALPSRSTASFRRRAGSGFCRASTTRISIRR